MTTPQPPIRTGIVHIGMNTHAADEAKVLNRLNASQGGAKSIRQRGPEQDVIEREGRRIDLRQSDGQDFFLASLGLKPAQLGSCRSLLQDAGEGAKDELAAILEVYLQAESGQRRMDRLVLSGHSVGSMIWGDDNGSLNFDLFTRLAAIFPLAAAQVRHLMVSACYTGGERNFQRFHKAFPALQSIWAYTGSSPGTWSGAIPHLERWARATQDGDGRDVERALAQGTRKGDSVATWNTEEGYQGEQPFALSELERGLRSSEAVFQRHFSGEQVVLDSQQGPLRDHYNAVQRLLQHPDLDGARQAQLVARRDQTLRLLFFPLVAARFSAHFAGPLQAAFAATGLPLPDFASLGRAACLAAIDRLGQARPVQAQALDLLGRGLRDLDPALIPETWI